MSNFGLDFIASVNNLEYQNLCENAGTDEPTYQGKIILCADGVDIATTRLEQARLNTRTSLEEIQDDANQYEAYLTDLILSKGVKAGFITRPTRGDQIAIDGPGIFDIKQKHLNNPITNVSEGHMTPFYVSETGEIILPDFTVPKQDGEIEGKNSNAHYNNLNYHLRFIGYEGLKPEIKLVLPTENVQQAMQDFYTNEDYTQFHIPTFSLFANAYGTDAQNCTGLMAYGLVRAFQKAGILSDDDLIDLVDQSVNDGGIINTPEEAARVLQKFYEHPNWIKAKMAGKGLVEYEGIVDGLLKEYGALEDVLSIHQTGKNDDGTNIYDIDQRSYITQHKNFFLSTTALLGILAAAGVGVVSLLKKRKQQKANNRLEN